MIGTSNTIGTVVEMGTVRWIGTAVTMCTGKIELGQGILTALTQIVSDELDVDLKRLEVISGDTSRTPNEGVTSGSLSIQDSGTALRFACAEASGLLLQAAEEMRLDLANSFFVGDAESDVMAAKAVGCRPVLVRTGRGERQMDILRQGQVMGYYLADDLSDAVNWILGPGWMTKLYSGSEATTSIPPRAHHTPGMAAWAVS